MSSPARFIVVPAGRRSGKTERAKRKIVISAMDPSTPTPNFGAAAPTRDQAKAIWWDDLKKLVPSFAVDEIREGDLIIKLINGATINVIGMDRPERVEGRPWEGLILDEYANMKEEAFPAHVRPALSDRRTPNSWCWLIGVPEGRNHYYDIYTMATGPWNIKNGGEWDAFTWFSEDILSPREIANAKATLDPLTFEQEYRASFVSFSGQAYYRWNPDWHKQELKKQYRPADDLIFCFDFNVDPGVAVVCQEMAIQQPRQREITLVDEILLMGQLPDNKLLGTGVIGEVYVEQNSNTSVVCDELIKKWGDHQGRILLHGDATGGARKSSQLTGTDWDIVRNRLSQHFGSDRIMYRVPEANPSERGRINAMNTRLATTTGQVRMAVDVAECPRIIKDLEGVRLKDDGSGELDKTSDKKLTHLTDALGYYIVKVFPVRPQSISSQLLRY